MVATTVVLQRLSWWMCDWLPWLPITVVELKVFSGGICGCLGDGDRLPLLPPRGSLQSGGVGGCLGDG